MSVSWIIGAEFCQKNAWLEVNYEDIVKNLDIEAKRLIAFCNLDWDPACLAFHQTKRQVRTASFLQVRQPIYTSSVERWRQIEHELTPLINVLNTSHCAQTI